MVLLRKEAGLAVVAALDDVQRHTGEVQAPSAWHGVGPGSSCQAALRLHHSMGLGVKKNSSLTLFVPAMEYHMWPALDLPPDATGVSAAAILMVRVGMGGRLV